MHQAAATTSPPPAEAWRAYFATLQAAGAFEGGSAIGDGVCVSKDQTSPEITRHITGYLRVRADSLTAAKALVAGNPVYESGGTIEIRALPKTG